MYFCGMNALYLSAKVISWLFHPLGILTWSLIILLMVNPYVFGVNHITDRTDLILYTIASSIVIPGIAILMMQWLKLVDDIRLHIRLQRVGPFLAAGIFYTWITKNLIENLEVPWTFKAISLGITIGIFLSFVINIQFRISMHTVGAGAMGAILILLFLQYPYAKLQLQFPGGSTYRIGLLTILYLSILISGLIGTARLVLGTHKPKEVWWGYAVGLIAIGLGYYSAHIIC